MTRLDGDEATGFFAWTLDSQLRRIRWDLEAAAHQPDVDAEPCSLCSFDRESTTE